MREQARPRTPKPAGSTTVLRLASWLPAPAAVAYLATLIFFLTRLWTDIYWSSDVSAPLLIAQRILDHKATRSPTYATQPGYVIIDLVTGRLPGHRVIWETLPLIVALAAAALIGWVVYQIASSWGATVSVAVVVSAGSTVLVSYLAQNFRGTTWFGFALALASIGVTNWDRLTTRSLAGAIAVIGLLLGLATASDLLLAVCGVAPLAVAGVILTVLGWKRRTIRTGLSLLTCALGASIVAVAGRAAFVHIGFRYPTQALQPRLAGALGIGHNIRLFAKAIVTVFDGSTIGAGIDTLGYLATACAATGSVALLLAAASVARRRRPTGGGDIARSGFFVFCITTLVLVSAAFVGTTAPIDSGSWRYAVPLLFAVVAMVTVISDRGLRRRAITGLLATVVIVVAMARLHVTAAHHAYVSQPRRALPALISLLKSANLHRGYAQYWNANSISWKTGDEIRVLPVEQGCGAPKSESICPYLFNVSASMFRPTQGETFVIADPTYQPAGMPSRAQFGIPSRQVHVDRFTVYVYPYDIATRFVRGA